MNSSILLRRTTAADGVGALSSTQLQLNGNPAGAVADGATELLVAVLVALPRPTDELIVDATDDGRPMGLVMVLLGLPEVVDVALLAVTGTHSHTSVIVAGDVGAALGAALLVDDTRLALVDDATLDRPLDTELAADDNDDKMLGKLVLEGSCRGCKNCPRCCMGDAYAVPTWLSNKPPTPRPSARLKPMG